MRNYLEMENITKTFGSFIANENINFSVSAGEVHALLGENGAGKSTLMNILSGLYQMDSGDIYLDGQKVSIQKPQEAIQLGIGMIYQHFMLVEAMTVTENIMLSMGNTNGAILNFSKTREEIVRLSSRYHLEIDPDQKVSELSVGQQQRVEIIKALYRGAKLFILDEPTAVLTPEESKGLFEIIRQLTKEGHTIIFISHKLNEVMEICDRITILRKGKNVSVVDKAQTNAEALGQLMVGRKVNMTRYPLSTQVGDPLFALEHIQYKNATGNLALDIEQLAIHEGEILGIAGVDGNGQSELAQICSGMLKPHAGKIYMLNQPMNHKRVEEFNQAGVSHIPEDRNKMGLVGDMSITDNIVLKNIGYFPYAKKRGWQLNHDVIRTHGIELIQEYDIRTASPSLPVKSLSGGNQQKVILAREMNSNPKFIIAVHPTRGVDIGASEYIHQQIIAARDAGAAVLLISADLDEILRLSDRIAVIYEGKIMGYENGENPNINRIGLLMAGKEVAHIEDTK